MIFYLKTGSVIGSYHRKMLKNNQDALASATYASEDSSFQQVIGVVCDGCGSSKYAEVGAHILANSVLNNLIGTPVIKESDEETKYFIQRLLRRAIETDLRQVIDVIAGYDDNDISKVVYDYFLSTMVGFVIENDKTVIFSAGDGMYSLNGETTAIDQDNCPNYISYGLITSSLNKVPTNLDIVVNELVSTESVKSIIIGTDGVEDLIDRKDETYVSLGKEYEVKGLDQFLTEEKYLKSIFGLNKRLLVLSDKGILSDDTTMIMALRKEENDDSSTEREEG